MKCKKKILVTALMNLCSISAIATNYQVSLSTDDGSGLTTGTLSWAILQANTSPGADVITLTNDIEITGVMKRIIDSDVTIQSDSIKRTINGSNLYRPLFIKSGEVIIQDLNIINGLAKGGDSDLGGGGGGLGGAMFIYDGNVTVNKVSISGCRAVGGVTGNMTGAMAGGGMYGNGTSQGGGLFGTPYGGYGNYQVNNSTFGQGGAVNPPSNYYGSNGGFGGGGSDGYYGGYSGGFGGGGAAGSGSSFPYSFPGAGGFGAGGGQSGGFPYGSFSRPAEDGDGLGGGIFIRSGQLNLSEVTIINNSATSVSGSGLGGGLFVLNALEGSYGMPNQLATVTACELELNDNIAITNNGAANNNNDVFDIANLINADTSLPIVAACLTTSGNNQLILNEDSTPNFADNTDFGVIELDNPLVITHTFSLSNIGLSDITLDDDSPVVSISGPDSLDFEVTTQPGVTTLPIFSHAFFDITFDPQSEGEKSATVQINFDGQRSYTFTIRGQSITQAAEIELRSNGQTISDNQAIVSTLDNTLFSAPVTNNETNTRQFEIHNLGNLNLELEGQPIINITGQDVGDFEVSMQPLQSTITPLSLETVDITFDPNEPGIKTATVEVINSDESEPIYNFKINGQALAPDIEVWLDGSIENAGTLDIQLIQPANSYLRQTFKYPTISNTGNYALNFDDSTPFELTGIHSSEYSINRFMNPGSSLMPYENDDFTIRFSPKNLGYREATLHIYSDDFYDSHFTIQLRGVGLAEFNITPTNGTGYAVLEGEAFELNLAIDPDIYTFPGNTTIPYEEDIVFDYVLSGDSDNLDFINFPLSGQLTFLANQFSTTFTIPTFEDLDPEGNESITLTLTSESPFFGGTIPEINLVIIDSGVIFRGDFD